MIENGCMDVNALDWSLARWVREISDSHDPAALQDYVCDVCDVQNQQEDGGFAII